MILEIITGKILEEMEKTATSPVLNAGGVHTKVALENVGACAYKPEVISRDRRWEKFLAKANSTLAIRGRKAAIARAVGIGRQELTRILKGAREPRAGLAVALFAEVEILHGASIHYASEKQDWGTPEWLFQVLDSTFRFTLDAAASSTDTKCAKFFDKETNGLEQPWAAQRVWLNPPYGKASALWAKKAYHESRENNSLVVLLLASRSSSAWWHDYVLAPGNYVVPIRGRIIFAGASNCAPFSSAIVIMPPGGKGSIDTRKLSSQISDARTNSMRSRKP